jgi:hypothetical protein
LKTVIELKDGLLHKNPDLASLSIEVSLANIRSLSARVQMGIIDGHFLKKHDMDAAKSDLSRCWGESSGKQFFYFLPHVTAYNAKLTGCARVQ